MIWLFASGHAIEIVLAVIAIEFGWLVFYGRWTVAAATLRLGPGILMLVALRGALTGEDWRWIALPLLLSFPLNVADLVRSTWKRERPGS